MKKILETMLAVMVMSLLACPEVSAASDGKCGDNITWTLDDAGNLLIEGTGPMYDYDYASRNPSPWAYSGDVKTVKFSDGITHIGDDIFYACWEIKSVEIPSSVTSIGVFSFEGCRGLTSIVLPEGLTTIGAGAFSNCEGLTSLTIPNSVTMIDESAFYGCKGLKSVTIGKSVTTIGTGAFAVCDELVSIVVDDDNAKYDSRDNSNAIIETASNTVVVGCIGTVIPSSVTTIGAYAFFSCRTLTTMTIPESVTTIGDNAFRDCTALTSVTLPNSLTSLGAGAFSQCTGLSSVTIGNSLTTISVSAFYECKSLTSIEFPASVTTIGEYAFNECESLASVTLPNSVTTIGTGAFCYCGALTSLTIPASVTSLGDLAFVGRGMTSIVVDENNKVYDSRNNCNAIIETATNTLKLGCANTVIPNEITGIGTGAFAFCNTMTSVTIPAKVTSLGISAFQACNSLTNVVCLAPNPPTCGKNAFAYVNKEKCKLSVIMESLELYKAADTWMDFENIEGLLGVDDITVDGDNAEALYDVYNMQGVKVGSGLRRADMDDVLPRGVYILVSPEATRKIR